MPCPYLRRRYIERREARCKEACRHANAAAAAMSHCYATRDNFILAATASILFYTPRHLLRLATEAARRASIATTRCQSAYFTYALRAYFVEPDHTILRSPFTPCQCIYIATTIRIIVERRVSLLSRRPPPARYFSPRCDRSTPRLFADSTATAGTTWYCAPHI
jgi:hypothetical protein